MFHRNLRRLFQCVLVGLTLFSVAFANPPANTYRSKPNIYGGYNYYSSRGTYLGRSSKNVFGGQNYYKNNGSRYNQTNKNGTRLGK